MRRFSDVRCAVSVAALFAAALPAQAALMPLWQVGIDNGSQGEFGQESGFSNAAPGSAGIKDDDWYFAGSYPGPIGTLLVDEPLTQFERAVTISDPVNRIHFILTEEQSSGQFQLFADTVSSSLNFGGVPFRMLFNGNVVFPTTNVTSDGLYFSAVFSGLDVGAVAGENIVSLERGNIGGAFIQFDFIRLDSELIAVPEPASAVLALLAAASLMGRRRSRV